MNFFYSLSAPYRGGLICIVVITIFLMVTITSTCFGLSKKNIPRRSKIMLSDRSLSGISQHSIHVVKEKITSITDLIEERQAYLRKVLGDMSLIGNSGRKGDSNNNDLSTAVIELSSTKNDDLNNGDRNYLEATPPITHFIFLVHGYRGQPADLRYLRSAIESNAENQIKKIIEKGDRNAIPPRFIIHSCSSNYGKTYDGVANGGDRIFNECDSILREFVLNPANNSHAMANVTISFIGNSLGGLYTRYAISKIVDRYQTEDGDLILEEKNRLHFNIFVSTCTPHLGIAGLTYFTLPRIGEVLMGRVMEQTGLDIFRISELIKEMCTENYYLIPLSLFRKRIAYANAYQTDFVVSTESAAFLHLNSSYPHHLEDPVTANKSNLKSKSGNIVATLHTPKVDDQTSCVEYLRSEGPASIDQSSISVDEKCKLHDELLVMSNSMDKLGWKKVLVDLRNEMPVKVKVPLRTSSTPEHQSNSVLRSSEVIETFKDPSDAVLGFPLGHNTMVAIEKHRLSVLFKGGRPLMDDLSHEVVEEILRWNA